MEFVRKNMNFDPSRPNPCRGKYDSQGVDLNRNYGYKFGYDNIGSANNPCDEQYRGARAFSEPEVRNMKNFLESHPDIKIVINIHSWGNLLITPYNWDPNNKNPDLMSDELNLVYEDLH